MADVDVDADADVDVDPWDAAYGPATWRGAWPANVDVDDDDEAVAEAAFFYANHVRTDSWSDDDGEDASREAGDVNAKDADDVNANEGVDYGSGSDEALSEEEGREESDEEGEALSEEEGREQDEDDVFSEEVFSEEVFSEDAEGEEEEKEETAFRYYRRRWKERTEDAALEEGANDDMLLGWMGSNFAIRVDNEEDEEDEVAISWRSRGDDGLDEEDDGPDEEDDEFMVTYAYGTYIGDNEYEWSAPTNMLAGQFAAACATGDVESVRALLEAGAELHPAPPPAHATGGYDDEYEAMSWRFPLALAASRGHLDVVDVLLRAGADARANNSAALALASRRDHFGVVVRLVQAGADVRAWADMALMCAVAQESSDMLAYLLSHGAAAADLDLVLVRAVDHNENGKVCGLLLAAGARIHAVHRLGICDALGAAARENRGLLVKTLLAHGAHAPVAERQASVDKALVVASRLGHTAIVRLLLAAGANVHVNEDAPLRFASTYGRVSVVATLLAAGADVHARDGAALALAAQYTHNKVADLLLRAGADVRRNKYQALKDALESMRDRPHPRKTLLFERLVAAGAASWPVAKTGGSVEAARAQLINRVTNARALEQLLLNASLGVVTNLAEVDAALNDPTMAYVDMRRAFRGACAKGHMPLVRRLISAGADVHDGSFDPKNVQAFSGPLLEACETGQLEAVAALVAAGASVSMCNGAPLNIAARLGKAGLVDWLLLKGAASVTAHVVTALVSAVLNGHGPVIALLLHTGAASKDGLRSAVSLAVRAAPIEGLAIVRQLLRTGVDLSPLDDLTLANAVAVGGPTHEAVRLVKLLLKAGANVHAQNDRAIETACACRRPDLVELLLQAGASVGRVDWIALNEARRVRTVLRVRVADVGALPLWIRFVRTMHVARVRLCLRHALHHARVRLDRPPTGAIGVASPTRAQLIAHLRTGGRRFAREYWIEGLPIFFSASQLAELGPQVPTEFATT